MTLQFLRGDSQAPKGHAILTARSTFNTNTVFWAYCVVPPLPVSLTKFLPSFLAAHLSAEDLQDPTGGGGMPIPPMLEEAESLEQLRSLAEIRDDDLCD